MTYTLAIIPARMSATRLPGKPLARIAGLPMIDHVRHRVNFSTEVTESVVATCDQEIYDHVTRAGGSAVMTSHDHFTCIDRAAEAVINHERAGGKRPDYIMLVQGDEPLVRPEWLDQALRSLKTAPNSVGAVNLMTPVTNPDDLRNPNTVKVVTDPNGHAIYFSREPIPSPWKPEEKLTRYKQTGLIAFKREALLRFPELPRLPEEAAEGVDMLRFILHHIPLQMVSVKGTFVSVDVPSDLLTAEKALAQDDLFIRYSS